MIDICLHSSTYRHVKTQLNELMEDPNAKYRLIVKPWRNKRSINQNSLMHMWFADISDNLTSRGRPECTPPWVKEAMKVAFLGYEAKRRRCVLTNEWIETEELRHTSELEPGEATFFLDRVWHWTLDVLGLMLPVPADCEYKQLKDGEHE